MEGRRGEDWASEISGPDLHQVLLGRQHISHEVWMKGVRVGSVWGYSWSLAALICIVCPIGA